MASLSWKQVIQHPTCQSDWAPYPKHNLFRCVKMVELHIQNTISFIESRKNMENHKFEEFDTNTNVLGKKLSPPKYGSISR